LEVLGVAVFLGWGSFVIDFAATLRLAQGTGPQIVGFALHLGLAQRIVPLLIGGGPDVSG